MAINNIILNKIRRNIESTLEHDFIIPDNDEDSFWKWFENNAIHLPVVRVNTQQFASILKKARCYGNSQTIATSSNNKYYEGFMQLNEGSIMESKYLLNLSLKTTLMSRLIQTTILVPRLAQI